MNIELLREPTIAELRHIVTKIWCFEVDFGMLRENEETDDFYTDVLEVIASNLSINEFASEYIGEDLADFEFSMVYDTLDYLKKKEVI